MKNCGWRAASVARASIVCACFELVACSKESADSLTGGGASPIGTADGGWAASADSSLEASTRPPFSPVTQGDAAATGEYVLGHHNDLGRQGAYIAPNLSPATIGTMHRDPSFDGTFVGLVNAQPLYVEDGPSNQGTIFVATESNDVIAFDETTGTPVWTTNLGSPADSECAACANSFFTPIGITGTPVIDHQSRTIYVDSVLGQGDVGARLTETHLIHALSIDDGSERAGWPVDPKGMTSNGHTFDPTVQNQRGGLAIVNGMLYVPYGSLGDCGAYNGWVIGLSLTDPSQRSAYATPGLQSGIWGTGGVASDGASIFVATGNGNSTDWAANDAVFRFPGGIPIPQTPADFFAPYNWRELDLADADLGGSGVILVPLPFSVPSQVALAFGKDGYAYMLDQNTLGGMGKDASGGLGTLQIMTHDITTAAAAYTTGGRTFVVVDGQAGGVGVGCPAGQSGDLVGVEIKNGSPPTMAVAFCADNVGHGSPIATTTDGTSDPIVWVTSDASQQLHAYDGVTGALIYAGGSDGDLIPGLRRFNTAIAVHNRIVVGAISGLYAFTL